MIEKFVHIFNSYKCELEEDFKNNHPNGYEDIVKKVVSMISRNDDGYYTMDVNRIHVIDDGDYQGTLLFIIASDDYQPYKYWSIKVSYGSCSGCDTFQSIRDYDDGKPTEQQVKDYMTLALHVIQSIKEIG